MAPLYREPIFSLIDKSFNCIWRFSEGENNIKTMDVSKFKDAKIVESKYYFKYLKWQKGILKLLRKNDIDSYILLGELYNLSTWMFLFLKPIIAPSRKIYFWSHGWYGREGKVKKILKRIFFGLADKTFLYGDYAKKIAISQGFPENKLVVIHNSLDHTNQLKLRENLRPSNIYINHFNNNNPTLIFIGRLTKIKKIDLLINALGLLKRNGNNYNLVLIGDGETKNELKDLVNRNNLQDNVWFYGTCYDDNKNAELIYNATLCVAPGNVGLTAMHTMVFGTPVISHNNFKNQMPEFEAIIPGKTGDFFVENDINSLANKIKEWIEKSENNRGLIRNYCYEEIDTYWTPQYQIKVFKEFLV